MGMLKKDLLRVVQVDEGCVVVGRGRENVLMDGVSAGSGSVVRCCLAR
jgi:hypothetical protein